MENGAFAPMEQMLDNPKYYQIHSISKASKATIMEYRVKVHMNNKVNFPISLGIEHKIQIHFNICFGCSKG